jgi:gluconolactonase
MIPSAGTPASISAGHFDDTCAVVWNEAQQELLLSVCQINDIWRMKSNGTFDIVRMGGEGVFGMYGLAVAPDGALWVAESLTHRVTRSAGGYDHPIAVVDGGFNMPMHMVVRRDGNVYFTDPYPESGAQPLNYQGLWRIDPQGNLSLASKVAPVGLAFSADQESLFITATNNYSELEIERFPVAADGTLGSPVVIVPTSSGNIGAYGLCLDQAGNIFHAARGGVEIYSPTGTHLGSIAVGGADDCTFGGSDLKTLFVTTSSSAAGSDNLWRVPMSIPGVP